MDVMTGLTLDTDVQFLHGGTVPRRMGAPYRHICCCLDESGASVRALAEARRLRAIDQGRLTLMHVVQFPLPYSAGFGTQVTPDVLAQGAHEWLDPMAAEVPEGEVVMLQGYPGSEACEWARTQRGRPADLRRPPQPAPAAGAGQLRALPGQPRALCGAGAAAGAARLMS